MKVGIIGAGAWGTALAVLSAKAGNDVIIWSFEKDAANEINNRHTSQALLGIEIPHNVNATFDMAKLAACEIWLVVVPAAFFRETMQKAYKFWQNQPLIVCTKGMEPASGKFMSEILDEEFGADFAKFYAVLSGPQFAAEVARGNPTGSTLAGPENVLAGGRVALKGLYLETTNDIIGTEICGVGKNAAALLAGAYASAGENERAFKLTLCWGEIVNLGRKMGAKCETFLGLCGLGDLFLTATSKTSRNYSAGIAIAQGDDIKRIGTVEGISAIYGLLSRADTLGISMPTLAEFEKLVSGQ